MRKTLISVAVVSVATATIAGAFYFYKKTSKPLPPPCPADVMMCPDGSSVARSGSSCEFGICKQEPSPYQNNEGSVGTSTATTSPVTTDINKKTPSFFTKITESTVTIFKQASQAISNNVTDGVKETSNAITETKAITPIQTPIPVSVNEMRYIIDGNKIVNASGTIVYTLPSFNDISSNESASTTHLVNVVPVPGAIPVDGLPGKYYLSENYFSGNESCRFANRIYILDVKTNTRTLLHEENSSTLSEDDPRSCNNEMYLLATEANKLILKYHTLDTNMTCDSTWSEPEKTWYLNTSTLSEGTKRYYIPPTLSMKAEDAEELCRTTLEATTTQP